MTAAVVIPIYQERFAPAEIAALRQATRVLANYPLVLLGPPHLGPHVLPDEVRRLAPWRHEPFPATCFANRDTYNRLMLSPRFYRRFRRYEYILIHQLDAYVFSDQLAAWCGRGYDYIGAPWFAGHNRATATSPFAGVGNGGFSLRRVRSHRRALRSFAWIEPPKERVRADGRQKPPVGRGPQWWQRLRAATVVNNTFGWFNDYAENEDVFWGEVAPARFPWFRVPGPEEACRFAFEVNPSRCYEITRGQLPFGCHAWEKYEPGFWRPFMATHSAA